MTMAAAIYDETPRFAHVSVMLDEVARVLRARRDVDRRDGRRRRALGRAARPDPGLTVLAFDRDLAAVDAARQRLAPFGERASVEHASFDEIEGALAAGVTEIDGVLADLRAQLRSAHRPRARHELPRRRGRSTCAWIRRAARPRAS